MVSHMSVPQTVFIDTSIFRAAQFNFDSRQFAALLAAVKPGAQLTLLLPEPTEGEVNRQIRITAAEAVHALKLTRKKHSTLLRVADLPFDPAADSALERKLTTRLRADWDAFKAKFDLKKLDYSGVDLHEIMGWYFRQSPPFGPGDKRKEFPDALAFAAIRDYAAKTTKPVAVISQDKDFHAACEEIAGLCPFFEVSELTNMLLKEEEHFAEAEKVVKGMQDAIQARIREEFPDRGFDHESDPNGHGYVDGVAVAEVKIDEDDLMIVGLGHRKIDVQFSAKVTYQADVEYDDPDSWISGEPGDEVMYLHSCEGRVTDETIIHGTATITLSEDRQTASLASVRIDEDMIEVTAKAPEKDERDEADDFPEES
jgi:hypothetical protein